MSVLRNLEAKLGRPGRGRVRPRLQVQRAAGGAGAQARQGDGGEPDGLRLARLRAQPLPRLPLAQDREQFASYEPALRKELSDYLLEHARQEGLALTSRPQSSSRPTSGSALGEFGIQAQLLVRRARGASRGRGRRRRRATSATRWSTRPTATARLLEEPPTAGRALLVGEGRRTVLSGERVRDRPQPRLRHRARRPERLPPPRRAAPRGRRLGRWRTSAPRTA